MTSTRETLWRRWALVATVVATGALAAAAWLLTRPSGAATGPDGAARDAAVAELVAAAAGVWDAARDPDVGRLMQPGIEGREHRGVQVTSNRFGLRERDYALPKPAGTFRVVVLGDSFVYGRGVDADRRLGAVIERELSARLRGGADRIECLHLGLGSWNITAACAYLRRQLDLLAPDLVVHVTVWNDLDDTAGARGFGAMGEFSPQRPEQRGLVLRGDWPRTHLGVDRDSYLAVGLDHESQARYRRAAAELEDLAARVEAGGGRYLHVGHWNYWTPIAARRLTAGLDPEQVVYIPGAFYRDRANWVSPDDGHWGRVGHRRTAEAIAGAVLARGWLDGLELEPWPEAREAAQLFEAGAAEAAAEPELERLLSAQSIRSSLSAADLATVHAGQVHGGVERGAVLGPWASMILARAGGARVEAVVAGLGRSELDGLGLTLEVDGVALDAGVLAADGELTLAGDLPAALSERSFLTVRLIADDYAYGGDDLRQLISARLVRVAVVPGR